MLPKFLAKKYHPHSMIKNCGNTQGDVDEEEDLCAVPPHIMRIMQVQNMSKMLIVIMVVTNVIIHN